MSLSGTLRRLRSGRYGKGRSPRKRMMPDCNKTVDGTKVHIWDADITGKKLNVIDSAISILTDNFTRDYAVSEVQYEEYSAYDYEEDGNGGLNIKCRYEYSSMDGIEASNRKAEKINLIESRARNIRKHVYG